MCFYHTIRFSLRRRELSRRRFNLTCTVFKFFRATSPDLRLTQLSMRRMNASMVAMVWMGQFIWLPAPGCSESACPWVVAPQARRASPRVTALRPNTSSTPSAQFGLKSQTMNQGFLRIVIVTHSSWPSNTTSEQLRFRRSAQAHTAFRPVRLPELPWEPAGNFWKATIIRWK